MGRKQNIVMKKRKRILSIMLCAALAVCGIPAAAYGQTADNDETSIEANVEATIDLNSTKDLEGTGYSWDASKHTLTLEDADLTSVGQPIFLLDEKEDVKIVLKGESLLSCQGAAAILGETKNTAGALTITGTGSLTIKGYVDINSSNVTLASCHLTIEPLSDDEKQRSFVNRGAGGFLVTGGAQVVLKAGLSIRSVEDELIVNGSGLTVRTSQPEPAIDTSGNVTIKNGGVLKAYNDFQPSEEEQAEKPVYNFCNGLYILGSLNAEEGSILEVISLSGAGIRIDFGDCILAGQEMYIEGQGQAVRVMKFGSVPEIQVPDDAGWTYSTVTTQVPDMDVYMATFSQDPEEVISCEDITAEIIGGTSKIDFQSEAVTKAKAVLDRIELKTYTKAYAATSEKSRRMKVWWEQTNEPTEYVTRYQVARSESKDGPYEIIFTTTKDNYFNTAGLTKGNRYYYKVRAYIQINDTLYYSDWSNITYKIAK